MFLDVKDLAVRKIRIRKSYAPGTVDYRTGDFRQAEPLEVRATAELVEGQIRISGELHTRLELVCARCLEPVFEEVSRDFDLFYRPLHSITRVEEVRLKLDDTEIAFFRVDPERREARIRAPGSKATPQDLWGKADGWREAENTARQRLILELLRGVAV